MVLASLRAMVKLDYRAGLRRESRRFHECLAGADPQARVDTCPRWTAADLLWHLTQVQLFWGRIVRDRLRSPAEAEAAKPPRPAAYSDLLVGFLTATEALDLTLSATPDDIQVWTWAKEQSVGFVRRRQAQEALIHRLDAELVVGDVTPLDAGLADDGVDEALTVILGGHPDWATFHHDPGFGRIISSDTGHHWDLTLGHFAGTSPHTGKTDDDPAFSVGPHGLHGTPSFTVTGTAADLDAWLWRRPATATPVIVGDAGLLLSVIENGIG